MSTPTTPSSSTAAASSRMGIVVPAHSMPDDYQLVPYDVLNGRGKRSANNVGNRRFNTTIAIFRRKYANAGNRKEKSVIIQMIIRLIRESGGHFLKRDSKSSGWVEIGDVAAYDKVSHALRDMTLSMKGNQQTSVMRAKSKTSSSSSPVQMTTNLDDASTPKESKSEAKSSQSRPVSPSESSSQSSGGVEPSKAAKPAAVATTNVVAAAASLKRKQPDSRIAAALHRPVMALPPATKVAPSNGARSKSFLACHAAAAEAATHGITTTTTSSKPPSDATRNSMTTTAVTTTTSSLRQAAGTVHHKNVTWDESRCKHTSTVVVPPVSSKGLKEDEHRMKRLRLDAAEFLLSLSSKPHQ